MFYSIFISYPLSILQFIIKKIRLFFPRHLGDEGVYSAFGNLYLYWLVLIIVFIIFGKSFGCHRGYDAGGNVGCNVFTDVAPCMIPVFIGISGLLGATCSTFLL